VQFLWSPLFSGCPQICGLHKGPGWQSMR
jgi:hypothetical protein